jgi:polyphosphate glucokinase
MPTGDVESSAYTLCIDVGGSAVKGGTVGPDGVLRSGRIRIATTYPFPPEALLASISAIAAQSAPALRAAVGFPGMVRAGLVLATPHFIRADGPGTEIVPELAAAWHRYPLAERVGETLGLPTRIGNDADVQGLAAISGVGMEVVLTLGTGVGSAIFLDGVLAPHLELSHHPLRKGKTYDEVLGDASRRRMGNAKWSRRVDEMVQTVRAVTYYDRLYIGGGNAKKLTSAFTQDVVIVDNADGIIGGLRLWTTSGHASVAPVTEPVRA